MRSRHETAKGLLSAESDSLCMEAINAPGAVIVMPRKSGVVSTLVSPTIVDRSTHLSMLLSPVWSAGGCLVETSAVNTIMLSRAFMHACA